MFERWRPSRTAPRHAWEIHRMSTIVSYLIWEMYLKWETFTKKLISQLLFNIFEFWFHNLLVILFCITLKISHVCAPNWIIKNKQFHFTLNLTLWGAYLSEGSRLCSETFKFNASYVNLPQFLPQNSVCLPNKRLWVTSRIKT